MAYWREVGAMNDLLIQRSAVISDCGTWRYRLERDMNRPGRVAAGIMVNPSDADHEVDDATIRKWFGFADRLDIGRFIIGNKFAFRSRYVSMLQGADEPVGPDNDRHLEQIMRDADLHIVAWGPVAKLPRGPLRQRWRDVVAIAARVGCPLYCWGTAGDGHPFHPLMLRYSLPLVPWVAP